MRREEVKKHFPGEATDCYFLRYNWWLWIPKRRGAFDLLFWSRTLWLVSIAFIRVTFIIILLQLSSCRDLLARDCHCICQHTHREGEAGCLFSWPSWNSSMPPEIIIVILCTREGISLTFWCHSFDSTPVIVIEGSRYFTLFSGRSG